MSNVEYKCPKCGSRLFAAPGGTPHHCPNHPDTLFEQTEEYGGPNFTFKDEGDPDPNKTGVATHGVTNVATAPKVDPKPMTEDEELLFLREQFLRVSGQRPDMRWRVPRLKEEIEDWEKINASKLEQDGDNGDDDGESNSDSPEHTED